MEEKERLEIALHFIGSGKPESDIWFCGINEHGEWKCSDDEMEKFKVKEYENEIDISSPNQCSTYNGYKRFLEIIAEDNLKNKNYFILNLGPFGTASEGMDICLPAKIFFGLPKDKHYQKVIKNKRHQYLYNFFVKYNWKLKNIFFLTGLKHGNIKEDTNDFLNTLYKKEYNQKHDLQVDEINNKVYVNKNKNIFVLPHASRISYDVINYVYENYFKK